MFTHEHFALGAQLQQALGRDLVVAAAARVPPDSDYSLSITPFSDAVVSGEDIRFQPHDNLLSLML